MKLILYTALILFLSYIGYNTYDRATSKQYTLTENMTEQINTKINSGEYEKIVLAGGCFWCTEAEYNHAEGIVSAISGYADSDTPNPSYEDVSSGSVKAREAVELVYDKSIIDINDILERYFTHIDPTDKEGAFADRGHQYTPAIYYTTEYQSVKAKDIIAKINASKKFDLPVAVEVLPYTNFYNAEEYHQDYKDKNPVRYSAYREASGRNNFVKIHWQDGSTTTREVFMDSAPLSAQASTSSTTTKKKWNDFSDIEKSKRLKELSDLQYKVTQNAGTEKPFTDGNYNDNHEKGLYVDIVSGEPLFYSDDKFDSGTGWPSFVKPVSAEAVSLHEDNGLFTSRTEVKSVIADSHLGHVFDDGPKDKGGKRYCINGAAMRFIKYEDLDAEGYGDYK